MTGGEKARGNSILNDDPSPCVVQHISIAEAASITGYSKPRVQRAISQGQIVGARKENGKWVIPTPVKIKAKDGKEVEWKRGYKTTNNPKVSSVNKASPDDFPLWSGNLRTGYKLMDSHLRISRFLGGKYPYIVYPAGGSWMAVGGMQFRRVKDAKAHVEERMSRPATATETQRDARNLAGHRLLGQYICAESAANIKDIKERSMRASKGASALTQESLNRGRR